jgi:hypothetical protein
MVSQVFGGHSQGCAELPCGVVGLYGRKGRGGDFLIRDSPGFGGTYDSAEIPLLRSEKTALQSFEDDLVRKLRIESHLFERGTHFHSTGEHGDGRGWSLTEEVVQILSGEAAIETLRYANQVFLRDGMVVAVPPRKILEQSSRVPVVIQLPVHDLPDEGPGDTFGQSFLDLTHEGLNRKAFLLHTGQSAHEVGHGGWLELLFIGQSQEAVQCRGGNSRFLGFPDGLRQGPGTALSEAAG